MFLKRKARRTGRRRGRRICRRKSRRKKRKRARRRDRRRKRDRKTGSRRAREPQQYKKEHRWGCKVTSEGPEGVEHRVLLARTEPATKRVMERETAALTSELFGPGRLRPLRSPEVEFTNSPCCRGGGGTGQEDRKTGGKGERMI